MKTTKLIEKAIVAAGGQAELARKIDANRCFIRQWERGIRPVPARFAIPIEEASGGAVKRHQIAPKVFPAPSRKRAG